MVTSFEQENARHFVFIHKDHDFPMRSALSGNALELSSIVDPMPLCERFPRVLLSANNSNGPPKISPTFSGDIVRAHVEKTLLLRPSSPFFVLLRHLLRRGNVEISEKFSSIALFVPRGLRPANGNIGRQPNCVALRVAFGRTKGRSGTGNRKSAAR